MLTDHSLSIGEFTIPTIGRSNPHHPFKLFTAAYQFSPRAMRTQRDLNDLYYTQRTSKS